MNQRGMPSEWRVGVWPMAREPLLHRTGRFLYRCLGLDRENEYALRAHNALEPEDSNALLTGRLAAGHPFMVGRLGTSEAACLLNYLDIVARRKGSPLSRLHARWQGKFAHWNDAWVLQLCRNAGFFNPSPSDLESFAQLWLRDLRFMDAAAVWKFVPGESFLLERYAASALRINPSGLEPYYFDDPWSAQLEGRRILVVHPFDKTITSQYAKRKHIFANPKILPAFQLRVVRAVQGLAGNRPAFDTWFEALRHMTSQIDQVEFDVALIGAGAYGIPLAAHVRRLGKTAVHMGGALQILFGIKGRRWDSMPAISRFYNEHWVRPATSEQIADGQAVEGGCYW